MPLVWTNNFMNGAAMNFYQASSTTQVEKYACKVKGHLIPHAYQFVRRISTNRVVEGNTAGMSGVCRQREPD